MRAKRAQVALDAIVDPNVTAGEWRTLLQTSEFERLMSEPDEPAWLIDLADELRAVRRESATAGQQTPGASAHAQALAIALTAHAWATGREWEAVAQFRNDVLDGKLLAMNDVQRWGLATEQGQQSPALGNELVLRDVAGYARAVNCEPGGPLDTLRIVADDLVQRFGWTQADAVAFLLTDDAPLIQPVSAATINDRWVTLRVHAESSPDDVADAYRLVRSQTGRTRSLDTRTLRAVASTAFRPGRTWRSHWRRFSDNVTDDSDRWKTFARTVRGARTTI